MISRFRLQAAVGLSRTANCASSPRVLGLNEVAPRSLVSPSHLSVANSTWRGTESPTRSLPSFRVPRFRADFTTRSFSSSARCLAEQTSFDTEGEKKIHDILKEKFPLASALEVKDISGGCGSMYEIYITSLEFKGKRTVLQHRMVNEALAQEIQDMHGLRIFTSLPS